MIVHVAPGQLGVRLAQRPAPEALLAQRTAEELIRGATEKYYSPLRGTRAEVTAIARLFPRAKTLLDEAATQQALDELAESGELKHYRYLHLATHGELNTEQAMLSAIILAD